MRPDGCVSGSETGGDPVEMIDRCLKDAQRWMRIKLTRTRMAMALYPEAARAGIEFQLKRKEWPNLNKPEEELRNAGKDDTVTW